MKLMVREGMDGRALSESGGEEAMVERATLYFAAVDIPVHTVCIPCMKTKNV
jgi:hypothetical protein